MTPFSLIKLVGSLSSPEKRNFKLQSKMQRGDKEYLLLFDIIDRCKNPDVDAIKEAFKKRSPDGSWDNTCAYLSKMLVDCLIKAKKEKDIFFDLLHEIQEVKVLQERSLEEEAVKLTRKIQQKAAKFQLHWIEYFGYRNELNYLSENGYPGMTDAMLIKTQMKARDVLKSLNHIQDHYSLFELLRYRLVHAGKITSEEDKKKLNDLILSEMVLVAGKSKNSFASQKLHLLFQSFFFTDIGDYHSALKSFYQLNELLEKNEQFLDNPPLDYLSALGGIIDSLMMLGNRTEIHFYLDKVKKLDQPAYPEYFRYQVRKAAISQQILLLMNDDKLQEAKKFVQSIDPAVLTGYSLVDEERQSELYFYCSLVYFRLRDWNKAHGYISDIMNQLKLPPQLLITKAIRLLNIIIYYEKGELPYLEYEIRSYKRSFVQLRLLKTEKLVFKIIASSSANKRLLLLKSQQKKLLSEAQHLQHDRYEKQLLKYFDFSVWMSGIIEGRPR